MMTPGRFITLEGIEGVGKTTQVQRLSAALLPRVAHVVSREPGGTPLAELIRELVLAPRQEVLPPSAELLLMFAARAVHLSNLIEPQLQSGRWVICDRFTDATYAYQGGGRQIDAAQIALLESLVQGSRRPDLTLLLDAPVAVAMARAQRRSDAPPDRFEGERAEFFIRTRAVYLERAAAEPQRFALIDATQTPADVTVQMLAAIEGRAWIS